MAIHRQAKKSKVVKSAEKKDETKAPPVVVAVAQPAPDLRLSKEYRTQHKGSHALRAREAYYSPIGSFTRDSLKRIDQKYYGDAKPSWKSAFVSAGIQTLLASFGIQVSPELVQRVSDMGNMAVLANHELVKGMSHVERHEQTLDEYGVWRQLSQNDQASAQRASARKAEKTVQQQMAREAEQNPYSGMTYSPLAPFAPSLLEIAHQTSDVVRSSQLRQMGYTYVPQHSTRDTMVVRDARGQPVVIFRETGKGDPSGESSRKTVAQVNRAFGRQDTFAMGTGAIAQQSQAPGGILTHHPSVGVYARNDPAAAQLTTQYPRQYGSAAMHGSGSTPYARVQQQRRTLPYPV